MIVFTDQPQSGPPICKQIFSFFFFSRLFSTVLSHFLVLL